MDGRLGEAVGRVVIATCIGELQRSNKCHACKAHPYVCNNVSVSCAKHTFDAVQNVDIGLFAPL
jgi:hypothetical protein